MNDCERRIFDFDRIEVREGEGGQPIVSGHAIVFGKRADLGWHTEEIRQGAADGLLAERILALWNHDSNLVMGNNQAGTLELKADETGVSFENRPPEWLWPRVESIRRKDVTGASFMFSVDSEVWTENEGVPPHREIVRFKRIHEISPGVAFPAYPQTDVAVRAYKNWCKTNQRDPAAAIALLRRRLDLASAEV